MDSAHAGDGCSISGNDPHDDDDDDDDDADVMMVM